MDALTRRFVVPIMPEQPSKLKVIYPWETINLLNLCQQLFELAINTGYTGTFEEFRTHFGEYMESGDIIINPDEYVGQYEIIPLANLEQILRTNDKLLRHDVVIKPIPYATTSNLAGGYTAIIG